MTETLIGRVLTAIIRQDAAVSLRRARSGAKTR
jgi:hypothetical protein